MDGRKRRRSPESDHSDNESEEAGWVSFGDEDEVDIAESLVKFAPAKRRKVSKPAGHGDDDVESGGGGDEDEDEFIANLMLKRNVKAGTEVVKKAKGKKGNIAKGAVGGGSFQSMGLQPQLLRALLLRGFNKPTPIQRLAVPALLSTPPRDLVGMARTGSGKTLAYMIPLLQRLGGRHQTTFGARALVLIPTRELALQILKVGKDLSRGWHSGDKQGGEGDKSAVALRWGLIVGGEGMDEQFEMITNNPDVIIATPGRLLHLVVEMNLDLKSINYVVFDEADRLFEQGFATALHEILHRLPSTRQTLLFSATLPSTLVEFTKAGLQDPKFVRLDADSKLSSDLRLAFFRVRQAEKDAALMALLREVIKVPLGENEVKESKGKVDPNTAAAPNQTLIFAATKHHVDYLANLLTAAGYSVSHIYGSLDQAARTLEMSRFRRGQTNLLVVTDVAARGIDIPVLENVINYDFPAGSRVFVHRVGRTARAGRKGWAWSLIASTDLPYLLDLQLFLGRPLKGTAVGEGTYTTSLIYGTVPRDVLDDEIENIRRLEADRHVHLPGLREVMRRGHGMYERTKAKANHSSYERAKQLVKSEGEGRIHPIFGRPEQHEASTSKAALLMAIDSFKPQETVFEIGSRGKTAGATVMKDRRTALSKARQRVSEISTGKDEEDQGDENSGDGDGDDTLQDDDEEPNLAGPSQGKFQDSEFYMSYYQKDAVTEKGYSLRDGASFLEQARTATFDLTNDDALTDRQRHGSQLKWDRKKKKFVKGTGEGADNQKILKTESGARLPITYRSGRFDEWKTKTKTSLPRIGEAESENARRATGTGSSGAKKFKHHKITEAKSLDPKHINYERKLRQAKKRDSGPSEAPDSTPSDRKGGKPGKTTRFKGKPIGRVKNELKSAQQIRQDRQGAARRKARNARPSRKGKH
ncbi:DEAD-domain-containing protein [Dacryopinax primogenitus]|uniref:RNA helicase n=1 Tax=Dacryopinax primogenitus (strain DJM 731) TaxID=1858805 RepID=M5G7Y9_DACPD|nr:DEAD-domain-containing protein [Dacryopinax primogenitus]EJU04250.1 DEAD-domain-containing protein [Dacryopinax primogenitus]